MLISPCSQLVFFHLTTYVLIRDRDLSHSLVSSFLVSGLSYSFCLTLAFSRMLSGCFLGSPGDIVLLSCLTNRHGQNESSSMLPKAGLCPWGGLPGRISMRLVGSVCTDCDRPEAPLAPHTLNRIMQPCLHRRARSMGWTAHANSCQGNTLVLWDQSSLQTWICQRLCYHKAQTAQSKLISSLVSQCGVESPGYFWKTAETGELG